jgi:hypothetical protein
VITIAAATAITTMPSTRPSCQAVVDAVSMPFAGYFAASIPVQDSAARGREIRNRRLTRPVQSRATFRLVKILPASALVVAVGAAAVVATGVARAGFTPAWSYVPAPLRAKLATQSGGSLFLPARTPLFYRYRSGAAVANGRLSVTFWNRVRIRQGLWRWTKDSFVWRVQPLPASTACTSWLPKDQTLQVDGNKVFWSSGTNGGTAWRCVTDKRGRSLVLSASAGPKAPSVGLAVVVASGLDVSSRTTGVTKALTVSPTAVRRGRTVLVRGVAGGCTETDAVTIISHAFPATRSFAGVPAVFAEVGSAGRFSAVVRIPLLRAPGVYTVTARCGGGNLGIVARLTVTR